MVDEKAGEIAENVYVKLVARIAIILASAVGMPLATWMVSSIYSQAERNRESLVATQTQVELLRQRIDFIITQTGESQKTTSASLISLKEVIQDGAVRDSKMNEERFRRIEDRMGMIELRLRELSSGPRR